MRDRLPTQPYGQCPKWRFTDGPTFSLNFTLLSTNKVQILQFVAGEENSRPEPIVLRIEEKVSALPHEDRFGLWRSCCQRKVWSSRECYHCWLYGERRYRLLNFGAMLYPESVCTVWITFKFCFSLRYHVNSHVLLRILPVFIWILIWKWSCLKTIKAWWCWIDSIFMLWNLPLFVGISIWRWKLFERNRKLGVCKLWLTNHFCLSSRCWMDSRVMLPRLQVFIGIPIWRRCLRVIGESAFGGCESLFRFVYPPRLVLIHVPCFKGCKSLSEFWFGNGNCFRTTEESACAKCESRSWFICPGRLNRFLILCVKFSSKMWLFKGNWALGVLWVWITFTLCLASWCWISSAVLLQRLSVFIGIPVWGCKLLIECYRSLDECFGNCRSLSSLRFECGSKSNSSQFGKTGLGRHAEVVSSINYVGFFWIGSSLNTQTKANENCQPPYRMTYSLVHE